MTPLVRHHRQATVRAMYPAGMLRRLAALTAVLSTLATSTLPGTAVSFSDIVSVPSAEAAVGIYKPISYQGKLTLSNGTAPANGQYGMRFKVFSGATLGSPLWTETWNGSNKVTMTGGLFSVQLGSLTAMTGSVNFNSDSLYLQVELDPANAGTYGEVFAPRRRFSAVPYALNADKLDGLDSTQFVRSDTGSTMSGTLTVRPKSSAKTGIDIQSTAGSAAIAALKLSTQGANHIVFGSGAANYDTNLYRSGVSALRTDGSFTAGGVLSGATLNIMAGSVSYIRGALGIGTTSIDANVKLEVVGTVSGSTLLANNTLTSSGVLIVKKRSGTATGNILIVDTNGLVYDATNKRVTTSGSLVVQGNAQFRSTLTIGGVTYTFPTSDGSASGKVLKTNGAGVLSWSTDSTGGGSSSGLTLTSGDLRYVKKQGDTMTGALVLVNGGRSAVSAQANVLLEIAGTASGQSIHAENALTSSGTLKVLGTGSLLGNTIVGTTSSNTAVFNAYIKSDFIPYASSSSIGGYNLGSQTNRWNTLYANTGNFSGEVDPSANATYNVGTSVQRWNYIFGNVGNFSGNVSMATAQLNTVLGCGQLGTDVSGFVYCATGGAGSSSSSAGGFGTGNVLTIGDVRYVKKQGDSMTGALVIVSGGHAAVSADANVLLEIAGTASGRTIKATDTLTSSGVLIVKKRSGTATGNILIIDTSGLVYDASNKRVGIGTATPETALEVIGTASGTALFATTRITSSGTLVVQGNAQFRSTLTIGGVTYAFPTSDGSASGKVLATNGAGQLSWTAATAGGGGITLASGDSRYVKKQGDTMTGALVIVNGGHSGVAAQANVLLEITGTASGQTLHAENMLTSSGTLKVLGTGSLLGNTIIGTNSSNTATFNAYIKSDFIPYGGSSSSASYNLGSQTNRWNTLYANTGNFSGNLEPSTSVLYNVGTSTQRWNYIYGNIGNFSGNVSMFTAQLNNITSCGQLGTDISGFVYCNISGGSASSASAGGTSGFGTGNTLTIGDARYVRKSGDSMTGGLVIKVLRGSATGNILAIDTKGLVYDANNKNLGIGTSNPNQALHIVRTGTSATIELENDTTAGAVTSTSATSPASAEDRSGGGTTWLTPGNATNSDNFYATASLTSSTVSDWLTATGFSFAIPSTAQINGIKAEIEKSENSSNIQDKAVRLVKGRVIGNADKASASSWPLIDAYATYGSSSDLWNDSWTPADINNGNFGVALQAYCPGCTGSNTAQVDHVRVTVSYTVPTIQSIWSMGADSSNNVAFKISNGQSLANTSFLVLTGSGKLGLGANGATAVASNNVPAGSMVVGSGALCVDNGSGACTSAPRAGGNIYAKSAAITGIDLAEQYPTKDPTLVPGEIVAIDPQHPEFVKRASGSGEFLLGAVSTDPGLLLGGFDAQRFLGESKVAVALSGRIPMKVIGLNGTIAPGDGIAASVVPGVGRKAAAGEATVGYALEPFAGSGSQTGTITVFMSLQHAHDVGTTDTQSLALKSHQTSPTADVLSVTTDVGGANNEVFRVTADGNAYSDGTFTGGGADYAEWFYATDGDLVPGDVVCVDVTRNNTVARCTRSADPNVMGIVSTKPAFIGNKFAGAEGLKVPGTVLVGLIGQVPARAVVENGDAIHPGDQLTTGTQPGTVRKARAGESTVGVALEGLSAGTGRIQVLISRRNQSMTVDMVEERVLQSIKDMNVEDEVNALVASSIQGLTASGSALSQSLSDQLSKQLSNLDIKSKIREVLGEMSGSLVAPSAGASLTGSADDLTATHSLTVDGASTLSGTVKVGSTLTADAMVSNKTLMVAGDASVGGDLYLGGALKVSSLLIPGLLEVDGSLEVGSLTALSGSMKRLAVERLTAGSGSRVAGTLVVDGRLEVPSGTVAFGTGAAVELGSITARDALHVLGDLTVQGLADFLGDVHVRGQLIVSNRQAGIAVLPKGGTGLTVSFGGAFATQPVVTATPNDFLLTPWRVTAMSATGFRLEVSSPVTEDTRFSWTALGVDQPLIASLLPTGSSSSLSVSSSSTSTSLSASSSLLPFPVDEQGVPLTGSDIEDACIRNQTPLDESGHPYSCARYRIDTHIWTYGNTSFVWNTLVDPPRLTPPDGYTVVTQAVPSVSSVAFSSVPSTNSGSTASGTALTPGSGGEEGSSVSEVSSAAASAAASDHASVASSSADAATSDPTDVSSAPADAGTARPADAAAPAPAESAISRDGTAAADIP